MNSISAFVVANLAVFQQDTQLFRRSPTILAKILSRFAAPRSFTIVEQHARTVFHVDDAPEEFAVMKKVALSVLALSLLVAIFNFPAPANAQQEASGPEPSDTTAIL